MKYDFLRRRLTASAMILTVMPASVNYQLLDYGFGSGDDDAAGTNYQLLGSIGENPIGLAVGANYQAGAGMIYAGQANVPPAPTFQNANNTYNRLKFTIDPSGNQNSGATFAIAISTDDFATTNYVQNDNTIGASLGEEDWQTYTEYGGAGGEDVIGLTKSTTYTIKVKARNSDFSESAYGGTAQATTSAGPSLNFDLDVAATDSETAPPYSIGFGTLTPNTVITNSNRVWVDIVSNAAAGAGVFIAGENGGLRSTAENFILSSSTANLDTAASGFGAQVASAAQSSGGPLTGVSPFAGADANVGGIITTLQEIFRSGGPLTAGRGSFLLKAKTSIAIPEATDYAETLTVVGAGYF